MLQSLAEPETEDTLDTLEIARSHNHFLNRRLAEAEQALKRKEDELKKAQRARNEAEKTLKQLKASCGGDPQRLVRQLKQAKADLSELKQTNSLLGRERRRSRTNFRTLLTSTQKMGAEFESLLRFVGETLPDDAVLPDIDLKRLATLMCMETKDFE